MVRSNSTLEVRCERSDGRRVRLFKVLCVTTVALSCGMLAASAGAAPVTPNSATDCLGSISKDPAHNHHSPVVIKLAVAYTPKGGSAASITRSIRITS